MNNYNYHYARQLYKAKKLIAMVRKDQFDDYAAELFGLLTNEWNAFTNEALEKVISQIRGGLPFSESEIGRITSQMRPFYSQRFQGVTSGPMALIQAAVYGEQAEAFAQGFLFRQYDLNALEILKSHNLFWVGNYYTDMVADEISKLGMQAIEEGLSVAEAGELFADNFDMVEKKGSVYWEGLANHVTTRAQTLGACAGFEVAGIEYGRVSAVMDHRTSDVCKYMHNKIIPLGYLTEARDAILNAEEPEMVKETAPWLSKTAWQDKTVDDMNHTSLLPPYHFRCRTIITAATQEEYEASTAA